MNPLVQVLELALEVCRVVLPRQPIDAGCSVLLEFEERPFEQVDADMVEERGEPLLLPFLLSLAPFRMRSSACDTLSRLCVRRVLCWPAFPSVPALGSPCSAAGRPALFAGFIATMAAPVLSPPRLTRYRRSPSPCRAVPRVAARAAPRPPLT